MARIHELLLGMAGAEASDLHMVQGQPPKYRIHSDVIAIKNMDVLTKQDMEEHLLAILTDDERKRYLENLDFD